MAPTSKDQQPAAHAPSLTDEWLLPNVHRMRNVGQTMLSHDQSLQLTSRLTQSHVTHGHGPRMCTNATDQCV